MDLKEFAARKRKEMEELKNQRKSKYMRRGDVRKAEDEEADEVVGATKKSEGHAAESTNDATEAVTAATDDDGNDDSDSINLPKPEITRRLRLRGEPIQLFGELLMDTFKRLRELELHAPLDMIKERQRNDFMDAMNEVEDQNVAEEMGQNAIERQQNNVLQREQARTKLLEIRAKVTNEMHITETGIHTTGDESRDQKLIRTFIKCVFLTWSQYLEDRPLEMKRTGDGKNASATFRQTELYMKPLLKHLKNKTLEPDLIELLAEIMRHLNNREYQMANDAYMRMSIGRAAWPMGVTQVGIHSRGGREKIAKQAHVLNDETKRKYISALKRMMTYMQTRWATDPSKSMEWGAVISQLYPSENAAGAQVYQPTAQTYIPTTGDGNPEVPADRPNMADRFESTGGIEKGTTL